VADTLRESSTKFVVSFNEMDSADAGVMIAVGFLLNLFVERHSFLRLGTTYPTISSAVGVI
jgi:hypothetical protein